MDGSAKPLTLKTRLAFKISFFISPHGFGHAARACAVMEAIKHLCPMAHFDVFTHVPEWFFKESIPDCFSYHACLTDIGFVQKSPFEEDVTATVKKLEAFLPFAGESIHALAEQVGSSASKLVVCDISPLGIAVAQKAGIPCVLMENFTWDWIYKGYLSLDAKFGKYAKFLQNIFQLPDYHIQMEPVCVSAGADLVTRPVSRKIRTGAKQLRELLSIPADEKMVLISLGGIELQYPFLNQLNKNRGVTFVILGGTETKCLADHVLLLPHQAPFYHPDLVNACDAMIGKLGYSTVAEVYHAGIPFAYIGREHFCESAELEKFVKREMNGMQLLQDEFLSGKWISRTDELLSLPIISREAINGSEQAAGFIHSLLKAECGANS
jgi:hypothetical protein